LIYILNGLFSTVFKLINWNKKDNSISKEFEDEQIFLLSDEIVPPGLLSDTEIKDLLKV